MNKRAYKIDDTLKQNYRLKTYLDNDETSVLLKSTNQFVFCVKTKKQAMDIVLGLKAL